MLSSNWRHVTPFAWPLKVLKVHRPFCQLDPTLKRSRYTSFQGRNLLPNPGSAIDKFVSSPSVVRWRLGCPSPLSIGSAVRFAVVDREMMRLSTSLTGAGGSAHWCCEFHSLNRFFSSLGKPHWHFSHFRPMCCSHRRCQTTSSPDKAFHRRLT